jgi:hypothetical protein
MSTPLGHVQVILEFGQAGCALPVMRWERSVPADAEAAFLLLGRGFEMAREFSPADISQALAAFLRGAMLDKQDVLDALERE